jgi:hypothetical protein
LGALYALPVRPTFMKSTPGAILSYGSVAGLVNAPFCLLGIVIHILAREKPFQFFLSSISESRYLMDMNLENTNG